MSGFLESPVEVVERDGEVVVGRVVVEVGDPVFVGHFPGLPVLPGVAVVEFAHRVAVASGGGRLVGVESGRFLRAVFPGVTLGIRLVWEEGGRRCVVVVGDDEGVVARMKLRYEA